MSPPGLDDQRPINYETNSSDIGSSPARASERSYAAAVTSPDPTPRSGRGPGRPRDEEAGGRVLRAALELLATGGFKGLRADLLAERSGVPKSTIYRRWPSLTSLAIDAVEQALGPRRFEPTGDPGADLRTLVTLVHHSLVGNPVGRTLPQIAVDLLGQPEVAQDYRDRVIHPLRSAAIDAVRRGNDTGAWSLPDPDLAVDMVIGAMIYRLTILDREPPLEDCLHAVDLLLGPR
jgi:AcrR family transcriptional regulator